MSKSNIVLIGMPGSGKSTLGALLAQRLKMRFVDTDNLIEQHCGSSLQQYLDLNGYLALRELEESVLLSLQLHNTVIATGGSAVYSEQAMQYLSLSSTIVYLRASLQTLRLRIDNYESRGLAKPAEQSFDELFDERMALYERWADTTLAVDVEKTDPYPNIDQKDLIAQAIDSLVELLESN